MSHDVEYLGSLDGAPPAFRFAVGKLPIHDVIMRSSSPWAHGCYVPIRRGDVEIGVLFQPFRWDEEAPLVWLFTTIGLSALEQDASDSTGRRTFRRFELTATCLEQASWADFRRAWTEGTLDASVSFPSVLGAMATIAHDVAAYWKTRETRTFAFGDTLDSAKLAPDFPSALLIAPVPELVVSGLRPYTTAGRQVDVPELPGDDWLDRDVLLGAADSGFFQLAPLMRDEREPALADGWGFFLAALLPSDAELDEGLDSSAHISNHARASRRSVFGGTTAA